MKRYIKLVKISFFFNLLFFSTFSLSAITDANSPGFVIVGGLGLQTSTSVENDNVQGSLIGMWNNSKADVIGGLRFSGVDFQLMSRIRYWPLVFSKVKIGLNSLLHFGETYQLFKETDIHLGASIEIQPSKSISLYFDTAYAPKITHIFALPNTKIIDKEIAVKLGCRAIVNTYWRVEGCISSYENFSYPLFLWPTFSFSCTNFAANGLTLGTNIIIQYTDMFTLTSYFDNFQLQFIAGYKF